MNQMINKQIQGLRDKMTRTYFNIRHFLTPPVPTDKQGMGAIPHQDGTAFRVWAPNAEKVYVSGAFNNWAKWKTPLAHEANGYWSANVQQARPGDEYKFVVEREDRLLLRTDPYAKDIARPFNNSVVSNGRFDWGGEAQTAFQPPALDEMVIYELHVGTFPETHQPPANFYGVIEKLPYLKSLGINVIEIMPIADFEGEYSWGYNPANPFAVSRIYGGREGLKALVKAAHAHGIAVILDVVYNHFGPQSLDLWQFDGWSENGMGGVYFYNDWRSKTPWADTRPDYGRSEVRQYIRDNVMMWFEEYRLDGLRWDATSYIRNAHGHNDAGADIPEGWQMMQGINAEVAQLQPAKVTIAEDLQNNAWMTKTAEEGGAGFTSQWDANFFHPVREAVITPADEARDMEKVANAIRFAYNGQPLQRVVYTESHDEVANGKARVPEEIDPGSASNLYAKRRSVLGAAIVFTSPGVPLIFQGQEFLEGGWFKDTDPLDWKKARRNVGIIELYKDLIALRRNVAGKTAGLRGDSVNVFRVDNTNKLIAYHRWQNGGAGDDVVVVANFAHETREVVIGLPQGGAWQMRFNSDLRVYDSAFTTPKLQTIEAQEGQTDGLGYWGAVTVAPYSAVILSQDS